MLQSKNIRKLTVLLILLAVGWVCFIWGNSMQVAEASSNSSGMIVDCLQGILSFFSLEANRDILTTIVRKGAHFSEYLVLASLLSAIFASGGKKPMRHGTSILFPVLLVAVLDEFIQKFVEGRSSEVKDVLIDFSGGMTGFLISSLVIFWILRAKCKNSGHKEQKNAVNL